MRPIRIGMNIEANLGPKLTAKFVILSSIPLTFIIYERKRADEKAVMRERVLLENIPLKVDSRNDIPSVRTPNDIAEARTAI
jgi:hypothetical protein